MTEEQAREMLELLRGIFTKVSALEVNDDLRFGAAMEGVSLRTHWENLEETAGGDSKPTDGGAA